MEGGKSFPLSIASRESMCFVNSEVISCSWFIAIATLHPLSISSLRLEILGRQFLLALIASSKKLLSASHFWCFSKKCLEASLPQSNSTQSWAGLIFLRNHKTEPHQNCASLFLSSLTTKLDQIQYWTLFQPRGNFLVVTFLAIFIQVKNS